MNKKNARAALLDMNNNAHCCNCFFPPLSHLEQRTLSSCDFCEISASPDRKETEQLLVRLDGVLEDVNGGNTMQQSKYGDEIIPESMFITLLHFGPTKKMCDAN